MTNTIISKTKISNRGFLFRKMRRWDKMKFVKGVVIGGLITTGLMMMYAESDMMNKKKIMKKGKQFAKKMGMM